MGKYTIRSLIDDFCLEDILFVAALVKSLLVDRAFYEVHHHRPQTSDEISILFIVSFDYDCDLDLVHYFLKGAVWSPPPIPDDINTNDHHICRWILNGTTADTDTPRDVCHFPHYRAMIQVLRFKWNVSRFHPLGLLAVIQIRAYVGYHGDWVGR